MKRSWLDLVSGIGVPVLLAAGGWLWSEISELKACEAAKEATLIQIDKRLERLEQKVDRLLERQK